MREMTVDQLRDRIAAGEEVAVVDIRPADAFADWHIPGAVNVPVIEAMRRDDPAPLLERSADLPGDRPLVMVCNAGISAGKAVRFLERAGIEATNLVGGMFAWSTAHSTATVPIEASAELVQVRRLGKGCVSYVLISGDEAVVVDPSVEPGVYEDIATEAGARITGVLETHVHADHVSRARVLATEAGATLRLPENERAQFEYSAVRDGDRIRVGTVELEAIATPGHTLESMCYRLGDEALLTGDTLFVDAIGRPDLEKGDAGALDGARLLRRSLRERVLSLPDGMLVLPGHVGGDLPFDDTVVSATIGALRAEVGPLVDAPEDEFARDIVSRLGPKPPSYEAVLGVNEGRTDLDGDPVALEAGPNRCAVR